MKQLNLKTGIQGELVGYGSLVDEAVNPEGGSRPSLHLDFQEVGEIAYVEQNGERQVQRNFTLLDALCGRASGATNPEWDFSNGGVVGQLDEHGENSVRWNRIAGLLKEASSTNNVRNPRCEEWTAGALGSGGALPTNWQILNAAGLTTTVLAVSPYANGWARVRLQLTGTQSGRWALGFETSTQITASNGQTRCVSVGVQKVSGSGLQTAMGGMWERTAAGAAVTNGIGFPVTLKTEHRRVWYARTLNGGGTVARVVPALEITGSGSVDAIIDVFVPQEELGSAPTSPILPPIGEPGAATRATETVTSLATVTRASRKSNAGEWDFTNGGAVGAYREYRENVPAITGRGLLVEESSTNKVQNPRGEGATGSTPPTNMQVFNPGGFTQAYSTGVENGWPYFQVRLTGTAGSGDFQLRLQTLDTIAASAGQAWTQSCGLRIAAGDMTGLTDIRLRLLGRNGSSNLDDETVTVPIDGTHRRFINKIAATDSGVTTVTPILEVRDAASGSVDITIRIYAPQLEQKAYPTSPILPPAGSPGDAVRAADVIEVGNGAWSNDNGPGTLYVDWSPNAILSGAFRYIAVLSSGSANDAVEIGVDSSGGRRINVRSGGVTQASLALGALSEAENARIASAFASDDVAVSSSGDAQATDASATLPNFGASVLGLGITAGGSATYPSAYIKQIRYFPVRKTNAELEALVGNS